MMIFDWGFVFTELLAGSSKKVYSPEQRQAHDNCGRRRVGPLDRRRAVSKTAEQHEGLQEAEGADDHRDRRKREGIRNSRRHHLGIHHRPGGPACSSLHLGHVPTWTGRNLFSHVEAMQSGVIPIL